MGVLHAEATTDSNSGWSAQKLKNLKWVLRGRNGMPVETRMGQWSDTPGGRKEDEAPVNNDPHSELISALSNFLAIRFPSVFLLLQESR